MNTDSQWLADRRAHLGAVVDEIRVHDHQLMGELSLDELAVQYRARSLLHKHLRSIWETAKADGLDPATDPAWSSVAMLCDLTSALVGHVLAVHPGLPLPRLPGRS